MSDVTQSEVLPTPDPSTSDGEFEIVSREEYETELRKYYKSQSDLSRKPEWSQSRIEQVINYVEGYKINKDLKKKPTSQQYHHGLKYDVLEVGTKKILIVRRKSPTSSIKHVLPSENYYDILLETHVSTGHGGRDKIIQTLKDQFVLPQFAVKMFLNLCKICMKRKLPKTGNLIRSKHRTEKSIPRSQYLFRGSKPVKMTDIIRRGQLELVDFQSAPDDDFKWLLCYQDIYTKFCFLRPLKSNRVSHVAKELLKIFFDVGCPHILQSDNGLEFTASVIKEVMALWPSCKILSGQPRPLQICSVRFKEDVENMMRGWMRDNNSTNWSFSCHYMQFRKNSSKHLTIVKSPYKALFGHKPLLGLYSSLFPTDIIRKLETEEDLEKVFAETQPSRQHTDNDINTLEESTVSRNNMKRNMRKSTCSRCTPRQYATMIYYYGMTHGNAVKAANLYRKHIDAQPDTGISKRMPGLPVFQELRNSLSDGVIPDTLIREYEQEDTDTEKMHQTSITTQICRLAGSPCTPRQYATMIYYYGMVHGNALKAANLYRKHIEEQPDTGVSKRMPGFIVFRELYKSLSDGAIPDSREPTYTNTDDENREGSQTRVVRSKNKSPEPPGLMFIGSCRAAVLSGAPFLEPKEEKAEPEPEACSSCTNTLAGFVYECVQCPQRVCGACGAAGAHGRHYVLRVPARSPRSEVELILDKVRSALELVVFKPSPRAKKKSDMADWASDESDTETDADDADAETDADDAAEQTVEVKMEFYEEEHDPFGAPAALAVKREWSPPAPSTSHTHSHEDMLQVAIKREPEDIEFEVGAARKRAHIAPPGKARPTNNDRTTTD